MRQVQRTLIVPVVLLTMVVGFVAAPMSHASHAAPAKPLAGWSCIAPECDAINYHTYTSGSAQGVASSIQLEPIDCQISGSTCAAYNYSVRNIAQVDENDVGGFFYIVAGAIRPGDSTHGGYSYFWEDYRPGDSGPNPHWKQYVSSSSYGLYERYVIDETGVGTNTYNVEYTGQYTFTGQSTNNSMSGDEAIIGSVIYAEKPPILSCGQQNINFEYNSRKYNNSWDWFSTAGTNDVNLPFVGGWSVVPSPGGSGGTWYTELAC